MSEYPNIEVGDLLTADLLSSMLPKTYTKLATQSQNTTTTLVDDAELLNIPLGVGTWEIELIGFFTVANTTPKLKTQWGFTGTWTAPTRSCFGPGQANVASYDAITDVDMAGLLSTANAVYNYAVSATPASFREVTRAAVVTGAGNLSLKWAQNTSNASNVSIVAGSSFVVRQVAS